MAIIQNIKWNTLVWLWENKPSYMLKRAGLVNHTINNDIRFLKIFTELLKERRCLLSMREMHNIYSAVLDVKNLNGDIAEVGVFRGGSAKLISEVKGKKSLYLFDTFEGMPEVNKDIDLHSKGDFQETGLESVKEYLKQYENVHFYKGFFPESAAPLVNKNLTYSFVHLDVDIYDSTFNSLKYFYDKMVKGAILISHDYNALSCPGVKKAFDDFLIDKPEKVVSIWDSQCMFIKQ